MSFKAEIFENKTPIEEIKARKPIGIIFSRGPSLENVGNCCEILDRYDEFEVCLKHQPIAKHFGGSVGRSSKANTALLRLKF